MSDLDNAIAALGDHMKDIVTKALTVEDIRMQRTSSIEFQADPKKGIYGKGLQWKGQGVTKQLVYRPKPDRLFSTDSIDLAEGKTLSINNVTVLSENELGSSITRSNLVKTGTLHNLRTSGSLTVDEFIFYSPGLNRLGFGTDEPNAMFSMASLDAEFIIEPEGDLTKIGTFTSDDIAVVTDDTPRITIKANGDITIGTKGDNTTNVAVNGRMGLGINNVSEDVSLSTARPIRIQGKKQEYSDGIPTQGYYTKGDIVWNTEPKPTSYVGWVCIREGTPGEWKPFGIISS